MHETNQKTELNTTNDDYLRKQKAKKEAILRYASEQESNIYDDFTKEADKSGIKGIISGFLYIVYIIFIYPIQSNRELKRKIVFRIICCIIIILAAEFFFKYENSSVDEVQQNVSIAK